MGNQVSLRASTGRAALLLWVALRLPLLLVTVYMLRESLVAVIEARIGINWPTGITVIVLRTSGERVVLVYDTERHEILKTVPTEPRIDGLAFDERADQLLIGSPLNSAVLRYDAETLERKSDLETIFGVRGLALDPVRNLLLCASLATNHLEGPEALRDREHPY